MNNFVENVFSIITRIDNNAKSELYNDKMGTLLLNKLRCVCMCEVLEAIDIAKSSGNVQVELKAQLYKSFKRWDMAIRRLEKKGVKTNRDWFKREVLFAQDFKELFKSCGFSVEENTSGVINIITIYRG